MEAKIKEFVKIESNIGTGFGDGNGSGNSNGSGKVEGSGFGKGFGCGCGSDFGYGSGKGYGSGSGDGYGDGDGYGSGSGCGSDFGCGYGFGYGYGDSDGIKTFSNQQVNNIDNIPTIITNLKGNIAKGFMLNSDFTLSPCFVVKHNSIFAHGETLHEAQQALENKLFAEMEVEERIEMFLKEFEPNKKYKGSVFFDWHNKLTGSCEMGRKSFIRDNNLSLDDEYTVDEFIAITENSYGSEIIKQLKASWKRLGEVNN
jgi:hypothetical protein